MFNTNFIASPIVPSAKNHKTFSLRKICATADNLPAVLFAIPLIDVYLVRSITACFKFINLLMAICDTFKQSPGCDILGILNSRSVLVTTKAATQQKNFEVQFRGRLEDLSQFDVYATLEKSVKKLCEPKKLVSPILFQHNTQICENHRKTRIGHGSRHKSHAPSLPQNQLIKRSVALTAKRFTSVASLYSSGLMTQFGFIGNS